MKNIMQDGATDSGKTQSWRGERNEIKKSQKVPTVFLNTLQKQYKRELCGARNAILNASSS